MAVTVRIPTPLRTLTGGADEVQAEGKTVGEVIEALEANYAGIKERLLDDKGVRRFVNIYANDEDIRFLDNLDTELKDGDSVAIVPAIAGGCPTRRLGAAKRKGPQSAAKRCGAGPERSGTEPGLP
jgi:molybdopterin synthase sulfur carrier subunit